MSTEISAAPGRLDAIRALINTHDVEQGRDELATPEGLAAWLREHGLADGATRPTAADVRRAHRVREALRALALANNGEAIPTRALTELASQARRSDLRVTFADDGAAPVVSGGSGLDAALGEVLAIVAAAIHDGTWARMKACARHDCQWIFYDNSRNRTRTWCSMRLCGNRTKVESYRRRQAADRS